MNDDAPHQPRNHAGETPVDPSEFWETRYLQEQGGDGQMWSGRVNAAVEHELAALPPGTALELGCGEGADSIWLAEHGWTVTAVDISANALAVATERAAAHGVADRITWVQGDLAAWHARGEFDLVMSAFLHSPVELPREEILRRATAAVAPGGRLLVVGHGAPPADIETDHGHPPMPTAGDVLAALELPDAWIVESNGEFERSITRDGDPTTVADTVLRVRRPAG